MGPRFNPYSRKSTPIQWGVSDGHRVRHDTRLPREPWHPKLHVRGTAPEHAPAPPGAEHASGRGTPGTSSVDWLDTRLPHGLGRPGFHVRGTAPEHAPAPPGAGHASGRSTPGTSSGSSGRSSCLQPVVGGSTPGHAPASLSGAGHASGHGTSGTSRSPGRTPCRLPSPAVLPSTLESDLSRSRRTGAPQLLAYSRGNRDTALQIASDPVRRELEIGRAHV